jgi:hypothetical protein
MPGLLVAARQGGQSQWVVRDWHGDAGEGPIGSEEVLRFRK